VSANSSTIDPFTEPAPEDGPSPVLGEAEAFDVELGVGLSSAAEDEGAGTVVSCADGSLVGLGGSGSEKVHAESRQMMLVPPKKIAPILDFPRVHMGPVCQVKPRLSGVVCRKCLGSFNRFPVVPLANSRPWGFETWVFVSIFSRHSPTGPAAMWAIEPLRNRA
jgi:hypothetical protein